MENNEDKLIQLHELVVNQRKTIDNLSAVNQTLTTTVTKKISLNYYSLTYLK